MISTITGSQVYWIMQLDAIDNVVITLCIVLGLASAITGILLAIAVGNDDEDVKKPARKVLAVFVSLFLLTLTATAIIPSTKTAAMMYVIPAVANNEELQGEIKEVYGVAKEGFKKLCEDDSNDSDDSNKNKK